MEHLRDEDKGLAFDLKFYWKLRQRVEGRFGIFIGASVPEELHSITLSG